MPDPKQQFLVTEIERQHGRSLRRFLASRLRNAVADVGDLAQEVYLRVLRVSDHETIRNPEAYVITIASNALHERALREAAQPEAVDILDALDELEKHSEDDAVAQIDAQQRIERLERLLDGLSPKARATLILARRDGYTLEEVGQRLKISRGMVKKYLAQAMAYCQLHGEDLGAGAR